MSTLVGDPLEEPMPLGAATVYLNNTELEDVQCTYKKLKSSAFQR